MGQFYVCPLVLRCCGSEWCRHSLCRPALQLVTLKPPGFVSGGLYSHWCWPEWLKWFSIFWEQKDPKEIADGSQWSPCFGAVQWCGMGGLLGSLPQPRRGSVHPLAAETPCHVFWGCECPLCVSPECHRLCPAYKVQLWLEAFHLCS